MPDDQDRRRQLEQALERAKAEGDRRGEALARLRLAGVELVSGDQAAARAHYQAALGLYRELGERRGEANASLGLGDVERIAGDQAAARAHYQAALGLYRDLGDHEGQASASLGLGHVERIAGELGAARAHFEAAVGLYRELGNRVGEAKASLGLGHVEQAYGDPDATRAHFEAALGLYRDLGYRLGQAGARLGLGDVERLAGELGAARAHFEAALGLCRELGDHEGEARASLGLGRVEAFAGELGYRLGQADASLALGNVELFAGDPDAARAHYQAALGLYRELGYRLGEADARLRLGGLELADDPDAARAHLDSALETSRLLGLRLTEGLAAYGLAELDHREGRLSEALGRSLEAVRAIEHVRGGLGDETARDRFFAGLHDAYSLALDIAAEAIARGIPAAGDAALEVAESARSGSLGEVLRSGGFPVEGELGDLLERIVELEAAFMADPPAGLSGRAMPAEALAARNFGIEEELGRLHDRIGELVSDQFADAFRPGRPDVAAIRAALAASGAHGLVYDLSGDEEGYEGHVVWCPPEGEAHAEVLEVHGRLAGFLSGFLEDVGRGGGPRSRLPVHRAWADLAQALLPEALRAACLEAARSGEPLDLVVVPDETTWALPFGALLLGTATPLLACAVVRVVPTLATFLALAEEESPPSARDGSIAHFDPRLSTTGEQKALEGLLPPYGPVVAASKREELFELLAKGGHLLAFGAHGDNSPGLRQSLYLSDGAVVSAGALLGRELPPLVSLGSCWAARRAPLGLSAVCFAQGTRSFLAPLFAADDPATGAILAEAYTNLPTSPSPAEALRAAQLAYLAAHRDAPPATWAALVAMGA